jgi:hypothetical protein
MESAYKKTRRAHSTSRIEKAGNQKTEDSDCVQKQGFLSRVSEIFLPGLS